MGHIFFRDAHVRQTQSSHVMAYGNTCMWKLCNGLHVSACAILFQKIWFIFGNNKVR